jgi:hypothetical protein
MSYVSSFYATPTLWLAVAHAGTPDTVDSRWSLDRDLIDLET